MRNSSQLHGLAIVSACALLIAIGSNDPRYVIVGLILLAAAAGLLRRIDIDAL